MFIIHWALLGSVMAQTESASDTTQRFDTDLDLAAVSEGDRVDPALVPRSPEIGVGESVAQHISKHSSPENEDDRTFSVRLVASNSTMLNDTKAALVYDPESDLFARLSGHTKQDAISLEEYDWKVRDIGRDLEIIDQWDVDIPDLDEFGETEAEFVTEWADILFGNIRHGDDAGEEIDQFDGETLQLRDADGRRAKIQYELVGGDE